MKTILVVEDNKQASLLYQEELTDEGYRVLQATNGHQAVNMLREHKPDVVVLDVHLPDMDGMQVLGEMLAQAPQLHVILNSAYSAYKDHFMSWAADACIRKSSDLTELKMAIKQALQQQDREQPQQDSMTPMVQ